MCGSGDRRLSAPGDEEEFWRGRPSAVGLHFLNGLDEEESGEAAELFSLLASVEGEPISYVERSEVYDFLWRGAWEVFLEEAEVSVWVREVCWGVF